MTYLNASAESYVRPLAEQLGADPILPLHVEVPGQMEAVFDHGRTLLTVGYYGADNVVTNYNIMGPVKAALEASVRYIAAELAGQGIRAFAVPPGPLRTRAASGIAAFDELIDAAVARAPERRVEDIGEVGRVAAFLVSGAASSMTGDTIYVCAGLHNVA